MASQPDPLQRRGWPQTESLTALRALINEAIHANHVVARRAGISVSELLTLAHLSMEEIGPAEIARRLAVTAPAATIIVDKLVARGYAERQPHESDRRRTDLVISEAGRTAVVTQMLPMFLALDAVDRALEDDEREVVTRYLGAVLEAYQRLRD